MTHKYGVLLQKNTKEDLQLNRETGTDYLEKVMNKYTKKAKILYDEVEGCNPENSQSGNVDELNGY